VLKKTVYSRWYAPLTALGLLVLSFGLLIPRLGLYWDDWPVVVASRLQGVRAFLDFYHGERPFSGWTYMLTIPLFGTRPLAWHIFSLLLRWVTLLGVWWVLRGLWPRRGRETGWMLLVFAVYPVFTQQTVAVAFSQHWICYALYAFSVGAMLQSVRTPRYFWVLNLFGVLAAFLGMLTMEYFWGLELLRPFLLWLVYGGSGEQGRRRLWKTLRLWSPYLLALAGLVVWRVFFFKVEFIDPNQPDLLYAAPQNPLEALLRLTQLGVQDQINNLIGAWYQTMQPADIDLSDRTVLASWAVALAAGGLAFFTLWRADPEDNEAAPADQPDWLGQALAIGLLGALFGPLPVWVTDRQALFGLYSGRFALAAMFGLSILVVGLLEWLTPRRLPKALLLAVLLGSAAGYHVRNGIAYYRSSLKQDDFYWQFYWRAPYLEPGTAILSADELFPYVGRAATAATLNLVYPQPYGTRQVGYWFFELYHDIGPKTVPKLERGRALTASFRTFEFTGSSLDSLVVYYKPGAGRCLWVLSPEDADNPELPELTRQALPAANLSRIEPQPRAPLPADLFGKEPAHTWCYFYQKAELARQQSDWRAVADLGDQAEGLGYQPGNANEWLPFIEGYAMSGRWPAAQQRTEEALAMDSEIAPRLCILWGRISVKRPVPAEIEGALGKLGCK
jgi:hypothetical protein